MRHAILIAALLASSAALADDSSGGGPPDARAEKFRQRMAQRFEAADTNHDGKISPDEAKAGMPFVAKHFAEIDADKDGYVTREEIAAYMKARRAEKEGTASP